MRHGKKFNHLGRKTAHRKATLSNMAIALFRHKRINTTLAKAKALRVYAEPLITKSRKNTMHSRRVVFSYLQNNDIITELFGPIADAVGERPGGYLRIIRTGYRKGDGAETAMIELVDFNKDYTAGGTGRKKTRRRRGKSSGSKAAPVTVAAESKQEEE
ncbi:MAG: 50S ribosomal protein L17 [Bacteroidia bacterium]|nr:50S ribosomal protein L17 [Bacteroidia bacterium]